MGHSPIPKMAASESFGIGNAMVRLRAGWAVRRPEWPEGCHVKMVEGRLSVKLEDGRYRHWIISEEDMKAEDWVAAEA